MSEGHGRGRPFVVALTGGIASGKTAVSDRFANLGVPVIDTDLIAREVVAPGQPLLQEIVEAFGGDIVDGAGALRRSALREQIFSDADAKKRLEAILHPAILRVTRERIAACGAPYCIVVVPLLVESGALAGFVDRVLVVDASPEDQFQRLVARDGVSAEQARAAIRAQATRAQRLAAADDVIENRAGLDALNDAVGALHAQYEAMALERRN